MAITRGDISKSYVSAFGLDFPEIRDQVIDIYNEARFTNMLARTGAKEVSKQWNYKTVYNSFLFKQGDTTGATVLNSGTPTVTTTTTAATSGFCRVNDMVEFVTTGKIGLVQSFTTSTGADTIVIKSVDGTNITHAAGEKLIFFSVAVGEKSDSMANLRYDLSSKVNKIQSIRETSEITNVENASIKFVKWNGENRWYAKEHIEKRLRLERMIDATLMKSEVSASSFEDSSPVLVDQVGGGTVQTTRGLNKYIENDGGILLTVGTPGTYALADLGALCDAFTAARVQKDITCFGPDGAMRAVSNLAKGLGSAGISSAKFEVNGVKFDYEVEQIKYGKYTISYANLPILDDPDLMGGTLPSKCMYFLPMGSRVRTQDGDMVPVLRTRYMKNQTKFGSDMVGEVHSGALSPINPNGTKMEWKTEFVTDQGLELLGPQLCARQRVLA